MNYEKTAGGILVPAARVSLGGVFHGTLIRDGKIIDEWSDHNLVTNEGLNHALNVIFNGATQIATWYCGIFEGNYTPVAGVTAATITAASTECTAYAASTRVEYTDATSSAQSMTNSASRASFVFNATKTIYGAFLVSASAKSATTGTLFAAAAFSASKAVVSGDEMLLTYTINASSV